jgi:hypothetical protein
MLSKPACTLSEASLVPRLAAVFFNGGMVTSIFFGKKLFEHRKALQVELGWVAQVP